VILHRSAILFFAFSFIINSGFTQNKIVRADSVTVAVAPEYDSVTNVHRFLFGESYRKLWAAPVRVKVFNLKKERGGLTILERGGGLQTKSLRLKDAAGKEWVLRSIQKYPERGLPEKLKATIAKDILQDQVVTGHPYAALTVPPFAQALGIPHSNPQIVYVPDDTALGEYRKDFGNSVLLFEEREPLDAIDTDNTEKTQRKLEEDNDVRVDQKLVLRARLLDMFLGDWDRHEDQWRWEKQKINKETSYTPVPRDRDKVYYSTSGFLPWVISHQYLKSNVQPFKSEIRDIEGYNYNARYFDRYFLNQLSEEDWKREIDYVQSKLTDDLIQKAIKLLPANIYKLSGDHIITTLKARRGNLKKYALKYYDFLSKAVDIPATDKHELFKIEHKPGGAVSVTIQKTKKDHTLDKVIYQRTFQPGTTKEIRLYGLAGNDIFSVTGSNKSSIKIRMIGGDGPDSFYVDDKLNDKRKLLIYDRSDENNILPPSSLARNLTSTDSLVNKFDRRNFEYNKSGPVVGILFNSDLGLLLGVGFQSETHSFRKEPYASKQRFATNYSFSRRSFLISYRGDFKKVIGNNDLSIDIVSRGPHNVTNFFGIGNETVFLKDNDKSIEYYRNRFDIGLADVRMARNVSKNLRLNAGLGLQYYTSYQNHNQNKFLSLYNSTHLSDKVFSEQIFGGVVAGAQVNTRNSETVPTKGVLWNTEIAGMHELSGEHNNFARLSSELTFYVHLIKDSIGILANRIGAGTTFGDPAFYQQMQLGGPLNLRGYRTNRFTGNTMFYHNIEFRLKLFDFTSYLFPGTIGAIAFNDIGRVWVPHESSKVWHDGYGGGIYIVPAELILIQAVVAHSVEGTQPYISIGFRF